MSKPYDKQIGGSHYQNFKIQPSKFVIENKMLFPEGCAIKYLCRHPHKGKKEDFHTQLRLAYTAYSRGVFDYWELASTTKRILGVRSA